MPSALSPLSVTRGHGGHSASWVPRLFLPPLTLSLAGIVSFCLSFQAPASVRKCREIFLSPASSTLRRPSYSPSSPRSAYLWGCPGDTLSFLRSQQAQSQVHPPPKDLCQLRRLSGRRLLTRQPLNTLEFRFSFLKTKNLTSRMKFQSYHWGKGLKFCDTFPGDTPVATSCGQTGTGIVFCLFLFKFVFNIPYISSLEGPKPQDVVGVLFSSLEEKSPKPQAASGVERSLTPVQSFS